MSILSIEIVLLSLLMSLFLAYKIKTLKSIHIITIVFILIITAPIYLGYLYNFRDLIYNQIFLFISINVVFLVVFFALKKIHKVILFISSFFVVISFILMLILNHSFFGYTYKTQIVEPLADNYYYEYFSVHKVNEKFNYKYPKLYKYVFFNFFKKRVYVEKTMFSEGGFIYEFLSDGKILKTDPFFKNSILIEKPNNVKLLDSPTEE